MIQNLKVEKKLNQQKKKKKINQNYFKEKREK